MSRLKEFFGSKEDLRGSDDVKEASANVTDAKGFLAVPGKGNLKNTTREMRKTKKKRHF